MSETCRALALRAAEGAGALPTSRAEVPLGAARRPHPAAPDPGESHRQRDRSRARRGRGARALRPAQRRRGQYRVPSCATPVAASRPTSSRRSSVPSRRRTIRPRASNGGTGLGLAIAASSPELMGAGSVSIACRVRARRQVTLPSARSPTRPRGSRRRTRRDAGAGGERERRLRRFRYLGDLRWRPPCVPGGLQWRGGETGARAADGSDPLRSC